MKAGHAFGNRAGEVDCCCIPGWLRINHKAPSASEWNSTAESLHFLYEPEYLRSSGPQVMIFKVPWSNNWMLQEQTALSRITLSMSIPSVKYMFSRQISSPPHIINPPTCTYCSSEPKLGVSCTPGTQARLAPNYRCKLPLKCPG